MDILTTELPNTNKEQRTRILFACLPHTRKRVKDCHIQARSQSMNTVGAAAAIAGACICMYVYVYNARLYKRCVYITCAYE
jgi:hypothetical protein